MTNENNNSIWQNLEWQEKMRICQQGMAHEEHLLGTYITLFIAIQAMFFAFVLGVILLWWLNIIIAVVGILLTLRFVKTFKDRGDQVDLWGALIYELLREIDNASPKLVRITERYEGCSERINKDWKSIIFGWGTLREKLKHIFWGYARRLKTTLIPLCVIISWIVVIVISACST